MPIGGKEAKNKEDELQQENLQKKDFYHNGILKEMLLTMRGPDSQVAIITAASEVPQEIAQDYVSALGELGCNNIMPLHFENRDEADKQEHLHYITKCNIVLFTGGDQIKLVNKLRNSQFLSIIRERYINDENFLFAGTSAGAAAMSEFMIMEGGNDESILKGAVKEEEGLSFLPKTIIDTHFMSRGRLTRIVELLLKHDLCTAFGICEDSALIIRQGKIMKAIGSGVIVVLEGGNVGKTNYENIGEFDPIYIEEIKMRILSRGAGYNLEERKFLEVKDREIGETGRLKNLEISN